MMQVTLSVTIKKKKKKCRLCFLHLQVDFFSYFVCFFKISFQTSGRQKALIQCVLQMNLQLELIL